MVGVQRGTLTPELQWLGSCLMPREGIQGHDKEQAGKCLLKRLYTLRRKVRAAQRESLPRAV